MPTPNRRSWPGGWNVELLEAGEIPFEQPSRHRFIALNDLLTYQDRVRRRRNELMHAWLARPPVLLDDLLAPVVHGDQTGVGERVVAAESVGESDLALLGVESHLVAVRAPEQAADMDVSSCCLAEQLDEASAQHPSAARRNRRATR